MTAARALLTAAVMLLAAACGSTPPPSLPSGSGPPPATAPPASGPPASGLTVPGTPGPTGPSATPGDGLPQPITLPMPGFAAYERVQMTGSEMAATAFTDLSCDALAGWLQAGDWRLDGDAMAPAASLAPAEGAVVPPATRWLVLSRPGDGAVAKLVTNADATGCWASISRLSSQPLSAQGAYSATTSGLAYQLVCVANSMSAIVGSFFIGDDGTRAYVSAEIPLILGEHRLLDGSAMVGRVDLSLATLTEAFTRPFDAADVERLMAGAPRYDLDNGGNATANVTSIDPLVAEVSFTGLTSGSGATQSLTLGMRCDLPRHQLTDAAIPPTVTPPPTVAPGGSMEVSVSGADAISETLAGPQITCSYGLFAADTWFLSHDDPDGVTVFLLVPPDGNTTTFTFYDFRPALPVQVEIDPARTGGSVTAVVDDRESEVGFTATGVTGDGRDVNLTATCAAVDRAP